MARLNGHELWVGDRVTFDCFCSSANEAVKTHRLFEADSILR